MVRVAAATGLLSMVAMPHIASAQLRPDVAAQVAAIGTKVDPIGTARIFAPLQPAIDTRTTSITRDVAYGIDPKETFDLFRPTARASRRPVVIFVHGGAFRLDDKAKLPNGQPSAFYDNVMLWAVAHGMVGLNMNYPLAPGATYPTVQHDIARVVAWARAHAAEIGGDPSRVYVWGHSAGASHVASFVARPETYADIPGAKTPVAGAILMSGIYDMSENTTDHIYFGPVADLAARSSVAGLVSSRVPVLVEAAELDPANMRQQYAELIARLGSNRPKTVSVLAKGHGHMSEVYAINTGDETITTAVAAFVRSPSPAAR